jgi:hypothetical protein
MTAIMIFIYSSDLISLPTLKTLKVLKILMDLKALTPPPVEKMISIKLMETKNPSKRFILSRQYPKGPIPMILVLISAIKI